MSTRIIPGPNVFKAISGSLFSTAANWSRGYVPTGSETAVIDDNCTINVNRTIGTLVVNSPYTASVNGGLNINVSQSFLIRGYISMSSAAQSTFFLSGKYNEIAGIAPGVSRFVYRGETDQLLPGGPYNNLETSWYDGIRVISSTKKATSNLNVNGYFQINYGTVELGNYDFYCSGSILINGGLRATLSKNQTGSIIFNGPARNTASGFQTYLINFSNGNPTVEVRNGIDIYQYSWINTGRGLWRFTTNNQSIYTTAGGRDITFDGPVSIENVSLSVTSTNAVYLNNIINGTTSNSQLINTGSIYFNTVTSFNSMTTGSFDYTSSNNTIGFTGNYSANIPTRYSTFRNLYVAGSGTKTLSTSSYVSGSFTTIGTLDLGSADLIVSGASVIPYNPGKIMKSGAGNITFIGLLTIGDAANNGGTIDFSGGNPTVELRNGITGDYSNQVTFKTGTGTWRFTTNNQRLGRSAGGGTWTYDCPISIENITLTNQADNLTLGAVNIIKNTINGTTPTSALVNKGVLYFNTTASQMTTGLFDFTSSLNTIGYIMTSSYTIPYGSFRNLYIGGNAGTRSLSQNTTVSGTLAVGDNSIFELSTYDLDVYGTTTVDYSLLQKSGPGNITFRDLLYFSSPTYALNLSGNPNVEFRNGFTLSYNNTIITGTGSWSFTTNNQTMQIQGVQSNYTFNSSFLISNINLTLNSNTRTFIFNNTINGTTAGSTLIIAPTSTIQYNASTQPMATGIISASANSNTFIYNSGSQNIKGGTYYNLTFLNGLKTLQGNVSVLGTFSTGSGATSGSINYNGFTLTNP
jgi:hypothetical protein